MEKNYKKYLDSMLAEAGFNPVVSHAGIETGETPELTKKLRSEIKEVITSIPELELFKDKDVATDIVTDAIKNFEFDAKGKPIVSRREQGVASQSQSFAKGNPVAKALYILVVSELYGSPVDDDVKEKIIKGLNFIVSRFPDKDIRSIAQLSSEDLVDNISKYFNGDVETATNRLSKINSTLWNAHDKLLKLSRFEPTKPNTTLSGISGGATKPKSKSKLIAILHDLDERMFNIKASTFGNNYQSVHDENFIFNDYLNSRVPKSDVKKSVTNVVDDLKKSLFSGRDKFLDSVEADVKDRIDRGVFEIKDPNAPTIVKDAVQKEIDDINDQITDVEDKDEILKIISDHVANAKYPRFSRPIGSAVKRYYNNFIKDLGRKTNVGADMTSANMYYSGRNAEIKKVIPEKIMKDILTTVYEYNPEILTSNIILNKWIESNYGIDSPVGKYFTELLHSGGVTDDETPDLESGDDIEHAKDLGYVSKDGDEDLNITDVKPKVSEKPRRSEPVNFDDLVASGKLRLKPEPKKESFYDIMRNTING